MTFAAQTFFDEKHRGKRPIPHTGSAWRHAFHSLQFKASLVLVLLILLIAWSGVLVSLHATTSLYSRHATKHATEWAQSLATTASPFVTSGDRESLVRIVDKLAQSPGVACAAVTGKHGALLASSESQPGLLSMAFSSPGQTPHWVTPQHDPPLPPSERSPVTVVTVVAPIHAHTSPEEAATQAPTVGYLHFAMDITATQADLAAIATHLWRLAFGTMLLVIPCSLLAMRKVIAPLENLTKTARAIAAGAMDARADMSSEDEIGELARSFNDMADRLAASQVELLEVNVELENRVQQRTRELEELAARDPLTGLYNRRHFGEEIAREFAAAQRYDSDLTCLMFDLDHFKHVNDQFGHRTGDEVLIMLGTAIASELRESDVAARFGGDEFILVLPQTTSSSAAALAGRVVATFKREVSKAFPEVPVTLSVGVASLRTTHAMSAEAVIQQADLALYAAKENGRNCTVTAQNMVATS